MPDRTLLTQSELPGAGPISVDQPALMIGGAQTVSPG